jgi:hypothetical protein
MIFLVLSYVDLFLRFPQYKGELFMKIFDTSYEFSMLIGCGDDIK